MAHKLTWYSHSCKMANLIDYVIATQRQAGPMQESIRLVAGFILNQE